MCFCLVFLQEFFWGQVAVQLMTSVGLIILVGWHRPLESAYLNNIELFNEGITLIALYLLMCFSDFVPEPEARSNAGLAFICSLCLYAAVHICFLITSTCASIWYSLRKVYYQRRNKQRKQLQIKH